jgi:hypothetical protein
MFSSQDFSTSSAGLAQVASQGWLISPAVREESPKMDEAKQGMQCNETMSSTISNPSARITGWWLDSIVLDSG